VVCLRLFRVFGPEEDPARQEAGVVARLIRCALEGTSPLLFGDGQQTRDLIYVDNVVQAIEGALRSEATGEPLNIASGEAVALNFLWKLVLDSAGKQRRAIDPTYVAAPPWEPAHARPQIARACKVLGWAPSVRLREGVVRTVNHHLGLRDADPYSWFSPPERSTHSRPPTPPPRPSPPPDEVVEVADVDVTEEHDEPVVWAPVPVVPGMGR
jgi:nucleoside-diphosphate-sugar epimerase